MKVSINDIGKSIKLYKVCPACNRLQLGSRLWCMICKYDVSKQSHLTSRSGYTILNEIIDGFKSQGLTIEEAVKQKIEV